MNTFHAVFKSILFHLSSVSGEKLAELFFYKERFMGDCSSPSHKLPWTFAIYREDFQGGRSY